MVESQSSSKDRIELLKNIVEILALTCAGIWAIYSFSQKDSPSLYRTVTTKTDMVIDSLDDTSVDVRISASIKNTGKAPFQLYSTTVQYWLVPRDSVQHFAAKHYGFFVPKHIIETYPDPQGYFTSPVFSGYYNLDQETSESFDLILPRDYSTMVIVKVDFFYRYETVFSKDTVNTDSWTYTMHCVPDK